MSDGRTIRVGYAGRNGHEYRSVGKAMVDRGTHTLDQVSAQEIRSYVRNVSGKGLLNLNPSYVFFRKIETLEDDMGPIGAMTRPITAMRSDSFTRSSWASVTTVRPCASTGNEVGATRA